MVLASVPCGLMGCFLTLDFRTIRNFKLVGIDLDENAINEAKELANYYHLTPHVEFFIKNAWELNIDQQFDLLKSHGLNFYEPDEERLMELYQQFYRAIKPAGIFLTSFLSPPPTVDKQSIWQMKKIDTEYLNLQRVIFSDILQAKWLFFTTPEKIEQQLTKVGFKNIKIIFDDAKIFPTVVAIK
jgi:SAM-dependent methyltransferase